MKKVVKGMVCNTETAKFIKYENGNDFYKTKAGVYFKHNSEWGIKLATPEEVLYIIKEIRYDENEIVNVNSIIKKSVKHKLDSFATLKGQTISKTLEEAIKSYCKY